MAGWQWLNSGQQPLMAGHSSLLAGHQRLLARDGGRIEHGTRENDSCKVMLPIRS
jgi:hypothetical protein